MELAQEIAQNYRFVVLREVYDLMDFGIVRELFPQLIRLKTVGYRKEYESNVLPFDSSDFVATHLLLCDQRGPNLLPVLGFKSVTLKSCDDHRITFPMLGMLDNLEQDTSAHAVILSILNDHRSKGLSEKIAYNGSFTILPELREDKALMKHLWDITFSLLSNYYTELDVETVLAVCATKFKVNKQKESRGWSYIPGKAGTLPEYCAKSLFGAKLIPMQLDTKCQDCQRTRLPFKDMWENRVQLDRLHLAPPKKAA